MYLLRFSVKCELWDSKSNKRLCFSLPSITITAAANEQCKTETNKMGRTLPSKMTEIIFWPGWSELLFPERSSKMFDNSKKSKSLFKDWISGFAYHWKAIRNENFLAMCSYSIQRSSICLLWFCVNHDRNTRVHSEINNLSFEQKKNKRKALFIF